MSDELSVGIAGEHLVCADLLLQGHRAFLANQNCPYDVAVEVGGKLIRIQVKATRKPRGIPQRVTHIPSYGWHVRRAGKGAKRTYRENDFDMLGLVALDIHRIAYMPPSKIKTCIFIRPPGSSNGKQFDSYSFQAALDEILGLSQGKLF